MSGIKSTTNLWTAKKWPYRPRPRPNELLTSYLIRIANGLEIKPISFLNAAWGSRQSLLDQDLDNYAPNHVIALLGKGVGVEPDAVHAMTLFEFEGRLNETHIPIGRKAWIMPTTVASNNRKRPGMQFCPTCLARDERPYLRRTWRMAFVTCCIQHGCLLRDRCPYCDQPLHPHLSPSLRHCFRCGRDISKTVDNEKPRFEMIEQQRRFETALEQGWAMLNHRPIYSHLYFCVIRRIAAMFVNGLRAKPFREAVVNQLGGDDSEFEKPTKRQPIEYLGVADRYRLFDLVERTMEDFPHRFVSACRKARLSRSHLIKDMPYVPFVYDEVAKEYLDERPYFPSEAEVMAAAAWLRRTQGRATFRDLKMICGESRAAIYQHMDYERNPATPSRWRVRAFDR